MSREERILLHYGITSQTFKTIEECSELIQVLAKYAITGTMDRDALIDEIADVQIMLNQIKTIGDFDMLVKERIEFKLNRQLERIEKERAK